MPKRLICSRVPAKEAQGLNLCVFFCRLQDRQADLIIHSFVDKVIALLCKLLGVPVLEYTRDGDPTRIAAKQEESEGHSCIEWTLPDVPEVPPKNGKPYKAELKRKYDVSIHDVSLGDCVVSKRERDGPGLSKRESDGETVENQCGDSSSGFNDVKREDSERPETI